MKKKILGTNPKDLLATKKISISKFPAVALIHGAHAMMNGAYKYGPYNWRGNKVLASIYVDAIFRHNLAWFEREEVALDSLVHHMGHVMASAAIILDAIATGNLIDDRPNGGVAAKELERISAVYTKWLADYTKNKQKTLRLERKVGYGTKVKVRKRKK